MSGEQDSILYIVVADDEPDEHDLIKLAVSECDQNHIVTSVFNGRQLLDLLDRKGFYKIETDRLPDLIILDLRMPLLSGLDALEQIKIKERLKDIPVYVLTGFENDENVKRAMELGAQAYFVKPLKFDELLGLVQKICHREAQKKSK